MNSNWSNFKAVFLKYFRKQDFFLIPNILCYLRILFSIVFTVLYLVPFSVGGNHLGHIYLAIAFLAMAAYTDFIDGFIARKFDQKSEFGTLIDPVADKFLQLCIAIALLVHLKQFYSVMLMFFIFLGKEVTLFFENVGLARHNRSYGGSRWYGKLSSFAFYVLNGVLLLGSPFLLDALDKGTMDMVTAHYIIDSLCCGVTVFLLLAWVAYLILYFKLIKKGSDFITPKEKENQN